MKNQNTEQQFTESGLQFNAGDHKLTPSNIGMRYFAEGKFNGKYDFLQITHIAMYAQSTDALLKDIDGEIAYMVKDLTRRFDVIATLIATKRTSGVSYNREYVKDASGDGLKFLPLYVESDGGLYQVYMLSTSEAAVNNTMASNETLAIIDTIQATVETPEIYVIASTRRAY